MGKINYDWVSNIVGSAITDASENLRPPHGTVIIAITSLADATCFAAETDGLVSELRKDGMPQFITTADTAAIPVGTAGSAHEFGDMKNTAHNDNGGNATGIITLVTATTTRPIKTGMIVESATLCPHSKTNPYVVKSIESTTSITVGKKFNDEATAVGGNVNSSGPEAIYFFEKNGQGFGGLLMDNNDTIPAGTTIYGRWTEMDLSAGRAIAYFGD